MRHLRTQLIDLLDQVRQQHQMEDVPPRLRAVLLQSFYTLLPKGKSKRVAMQCRTVTHGTLHRHIFAVRCPDQAFYLDAIKGYLLRRDIQPISQQTMVARMECSSDGCILELRKPGIHDEGNFMFIALHISATVTPDIEPLRRDIMAILQAVDLSVKDYKSMRSLAAKAAKSLAVESADAAALLEWMNSGHFLYFGIHHKNSSLGVARNSRVLKRIAPGLPEQLSSRRAASETGITWLSLSTSTYYLYSAASVELVRIGWRKGSGEIEEAVIIGHFSRSARHANASHLPVLTTQWQKLAADPLLQHSAFYRREIRTLFDRMPKRILLASQTHEWLEPLKAIIDLAGPMQLVARLIPSIEGDMDILMVAITAKRFGPHVMRHLIQALNDAGQITHGYDNFGVGPHRIILIGINRNSPAIQQGELDKIILGCITFWKDLARMEVIQHADIFDIPATLNELEQIPSLYQDLFPPVQFTRDLQMRKKVLKDRQTRVHITPRVKATGDEVGLHIYSLKQPSLGTLVDTIRTFGLDPVQESVVPFGKDPSCLNDPDSECRCIHISALICRAPCHLDSNVSQRLKHGLEQVLNGVADRDPINALLISAGLEIEHLAILITLRNHLIQLVPDAAKLPLSDMMLRHPAATAGLYRMFAARHHPDISTAVQGKAKQSFAEVMSTINNLSDDRWFRALAELVETSLRSNAFIRKEGAAVGIKIDPAQLSYIPQPAPYREIFVHSVHMEGVHLRAGPIARGGLRFSDRHTDFRTEVLELMHTQVVKNGQIVPTGSKGGFVVHDASGPAFVLEQYCVFIDTLLSLTDNFYSGTSEPPAGIRVADNDADDPYLVVAADKGTAHFSDSANQHSLSAGFWLGDAFASGGRHGFDHKKIGITARGAWVSAAHHFAKLGVDANTDPITCVGIGSMSGDVFGNGMLINPNIKLVAAFNHSHIFLDPEPDTEKAFSERKRLFAEAAGWSSYNRQLISKGGGIFERNAKLIPLSQRARKLLAIKEKELSGEAVVKAILSAPVDLLYNGGIGTYIKASSETHADVFDPANNSVRIDAVALRCRVVCEGGNLGMTQKARIEYALTGGMINTDAMDNSAGVDMSDHEVNLKILFASLPEKRLSFRQRNKLLESLADEVTVHCLKDSLLQSRALTLAEANAVRHPLSLRRLRNNLGKAGWLDKTIAANIEEDDLLGLRPQLSTLLGQEKNRIHARLNEGAFHKQSAFNETLLKSYFPTPLHRRFGASFSTHPLAPEIIHTIAANHVVNHFGLGAVHHLESVIDNPVGDIVEALLISETVLDTADLRDQLWSQFQHSDQANQLQLKLQEYVQRFAEELLRLCSVEKIDHAWIKKQRRGLATFRNQLSRGSVSPTASLNDELSRQLAVTFELAYTACALHISSSKGVSLARALSASKACLTLLPIRQMEEMLRSSDWGQSDAHNLRKEWLQRLALMKEKAICDLLENSKMNFEKVGKRTWHQHQLWPLVDSCISSMKEEILKVKPGEQRGAESRRTRLLLGLTRLESIIESSADIESN